MNATSLTVEHLSSAPYALESWRSAAALVRLRWRQFLAADHSTRPATFAAYVAALDVEEAAADELLAVTRSE
jgi:hypothetical protein